MPWWFPCLRDIGLQQMSCELHRTVQVLCDKLELPPQISSWLQSCSGSHITNSYLVLFNRKYPFLIICVLPFLWDPLLFPLCRRLPRWAGRVTLGRRRAGPQALLGSMSVGKERMWGGTGS